MRIYDVCYVDLHCLAEEHGRAAFVKTVVRHQPALQFRCRMLQSLHEGASASKHAYIVGGLEPRPADGLTLDQIDADLHIERCLHCVPSTSPSP